MNKIKKYILEKYLPDYARQVFVVQIENQKRDIQRLKEKIKELEQENQEYINYANCLSSELIGMEKVLKRKIVINIGGKNAKESE